jgi:hypothetical protein
MGLNFQKKLANAERVPAHRRKDCLDAFYTFPVR